ncbi:hypothetical protein N431DRAFT_467084 [Stipitochalara longipes BDJ]|nr:hypothetical protein N431DRAFT_467084 [Stipitochalara longipes BDJ]
MASPNRRRQMERDSMSEDEDLEPCRPTKRARVALACQRCRARKQKCDGALNSARHVPDWVFTATTKHA